MAYPQKIEAPSLKEGQKLYLLKTVKWHKTVIKSGNKEYGRVEHSLSKEELEQLATSETFTNRCIAAATGYALDRLCRDKDFLVRAEVARTTKDKEQLAMLANDESPFVREIVEGRKKKNRKETKALI